MVFLIDLWLPKQLYATTDNTPVKNKDCFFMVTIMIDSNSIKINPRIANF